MGNQSDAAETVLARALYRALQECAPNAVVCSDGDLIN
jgi:hypothetical protein